jgi:hypothetical protein
MSNNILDFNRRSPGEQLINTKINDLIEAAEPPSENTRKYLGASTVGADCLRKIQYDWRVDPVYPARSKDIFQRGHFFEALTRGHLVKAGFKFAPTEHLKFEALDGLLRGHADGILLAGPGVDGLTYPCLWECKALKAKGWNAVANNGLTGPYTVYAAQVALYQHFLELQNPALFSVICADTCERVHFTVPFEAVRAQAWIDRAEVVIEATRRGDLLDRLTTDPTDWRCKMCGHRERCWKDQTNGETHE